jgi:hypothetical protein
MKNAPVVYAPLLAVVLAACGDNPVAPADPCPTAADVEAFGDHSKALAMCSA